MRYYGPGVYRLEDGSYLPQRSLVNPLKIIQTSDTSVEITVETMNLDLDPSYYVVSYKIKGYTNWTEHPNVTTNPFTITGLSRGLTYDIQIIAHWVEGTTSIATEPFSTQFVMDQEIAGGTTLGKVTDPTKIISNINGGVLTLSSKSSVDKQYTVATRAFDAIELPSSTLTLLPGGKNSAPSYAEYYYGFGTSLNFSALTDGGKAGGGIGFFTDERANVGYYLMLDTTVSSGTNSRKALRWVKLESGKGTVKVLATTTEAGIIAGEIYNVDIRVKIKGFDITMVAFINGGVISATDKTYYDPSTKKVQRIVAPSQNVTLVSSEGKVYFDYVYGKKADKKYYEDSSAITKRYFGKYSNDFLNTAFGELIFEESPIENNGKEYVDEFGNTVREIRKYEVQFSKSPALPIGWENSTQPAAAVISQDWNNFSSRVWLLNNSSTTIPLSNGSDTQFYLFGNPIYETSALEYNTADESDYSVKKPAIFETAWIQRTEDAEALGQWIKKQLINKGKIASMSIFGNPLIQVGDIVSIKHAYQNYTGTESFIVTSVTHSYNNGLETDIICRTI